MRRQWTVILFILLTAGMTVAAPDSIVFVASTSIGREAPAIYRVGSDGSIDKIALEADDFGGGLAHGMRRPVPSPDQKKIAFTIDGELWIHDLEYGSTIPVTDVAQPADPPWKSVFVTIKGWSPDSRRVIYRIGGDDTFVLCNHGEPPLKPRDAPFGFYVYDVENMKSRALDELNPADYLMIGHEAWLRDGSFLLTSPAPADTNEFPVKPRKISRFVPPSHGGNFFRVSGDASNSSFVGSIDGTASQPALSDGHTHLAFTGSFTDEDGKSFTQIAEIDLRDGTVRRLAPRNRWDHSHQGPQYRPGGADAAFVATTRLCLGENCEQRANQYSVVVGGKSYGSCSQGIRYDWVNEETVVVLCGSELSVIDVKSGATIGSTEIPRPTAAP